MTEHHTENFGDPPHHGRVVFLGHIVSRRFILATPPLPPAFRNGKEGKHFAYAQDLLEPANSDQFRSTAHGRMLAMAQTSPLIGVSLSRCTSDRYRLRRSNGVRAVKTPTHASPHPINKIHTNDPSDMCMTRAGGMVIPRHESGDPFGLLLRERIVFLGNQVDDFTADAVISQLLLLDAQDPKKVRRTAIVIFYSGVNVYTPVVRLLLLGQKPPHANLSPNHICVLLCPLEKDIKLFINSPGGSVTAGMGIYDAMQMCRADVSTVCMGLAASMGAFLLTSGARGKRLSMPNARIMIHQPLGGASGQAVDIEIQAREIMYHKANLNRLMAFHTGQDVKQIDEDTDRDRYMSPLEAKNYGIIDQVIGGDDAGLKIEGEPKEYLKTKASYIAWGDEMDSA